MDAAVGSFDPHPCGNLTQMLTLTLNLNTDLIHIMPAANYRNPLPVTAEQLCLTVITQNLKELIPFIVGNRLVF